MRKAQSKTKMIFAVVGIFLALLFMVVLIMKATSNLDNLFEPDEWALKTVNEDNLYQSATFAGDAKGVIANGADGLTVKLDDDNAIKIGGTSEIDQSIRIATYTLKANTSYIFDSDLNDGTNKTYYMVVKAGDVEIAKSYTGPVIISASEITADTEVTINLVVKADVGLSDTLKPILCIGNDTDDIVKYYN